MKGVAGSRISVENPTGKLSDSRPIMRSRCRNELESEAKAEALAEVTEGRRGQRRQSPGPGQVSRRDEEGYSFGIPVAELLLS
jgi:hypothetical protein